MSSIGFILAAIVGIVSRHALAMEAHHSNQLNMSSLASIV